MTRDQQRLFDRDVTSCSACPRLVAWREGVAQEKVKRYRGEVYWGKPVPSFGATDAQLLIVGLAPAAHGANRTGRMFTGDRSGDWLYRAMHETGFCSQPISTTTSDGLKLIDARITAVAHCAPPQNKLLRTEIENCAAFLDREIRLMSRLRVVVALGRTAFSQVARRFTSTLRGSAAFKHGVKCILRDDLTLIGSYHPSQQNTFTGRLTAPMLLSVFHQAQSLISR